ncbi:MAG TPA: hypothetical protein VD996_04765 [Chitinophagaceae bacterium]|nr:hypothetical protein [Chitinophagaceae bacterium]
MQYILKTLTRLSWLFVPGFCFSQSTMLPRESKHAQFMERLQILMQDNNELNLHTLRPFSRQTAVNVAMLADSLHTQFPYDHYHNLSKVDQYNLQSLLLNNREWYTGDQSKFNSKKPLWNTFYKTRGDFFSVNEKDFFFAVNPVVQQQQSIETADGGRVFLNAKGLTARGLIARRIGFDAYITDNQERGPEFFRQRVGFYDAVPGVGFYKPFKRTGVDYIDARGSIHFNAAKYFRFQFGYDKNFIGSGYRSLMLSDFGNSYLFLKINTTIWKFQYHNLFMELVPQTINISAGNKLLDKKYMAVHHLSMNVTRWLNIGLFEAVVFGRKNKFELSYLNPVIFLRASEQQNGSADNAIIGLDFKANAGHQGQFYGQMVLDEFVLKEIRSGKGWWANKYGLQFGVKYIDALDIKNLDVQTEVNMVRPFTYSHYDSVANYSHYNQPLAHPLGSNFVEAIAVVRYQPKPKWSGQARIIFWKQGIDTLNGNGGNNIFRNSSTRSSDYGHKLAAAPAAKGLNVSGLVSYEWKENLFIEGSLLFRTWRPDGFSADNTLMLTLGVRMNMFRREYDY